MREFFTQDEIAVFAKALSSKLRVSILQYLAAYPGTGLMDLATVFGVSRAAITQNIKALTDAGLVEFGQSSGKGGARKACYLKEQQFLLNLGRPFARQKIYATEMPIGQYIDHEIMPTCGIATTETLIGRLLRRSAARQCRHPLVRLRLCRIPSAELFAEGTDHRGDAVLTRALVRSPGCRRELAE